MTKLEAAVIVISAVGGAILAYREADDMCPWPIVFILGGILTLVGLIVCGVLYVAIGTLLGFGE